jgi:hypothetical protein
MRHDPSDRLTPMGVLAGLDGLGRLAPNTPRRSP